MCWWDLKSDDLKKAKLWKAWNATKAQKSNTQQEMKEEKKNHRLCSWHVMFSFFGTLCNLCNWTCCSEDLACMYDVHGCWQGYEGMFWDFLKCCWSFFEIGHNNIHWSLTNQTYVDKDLKMFTFVHQFLKKRHKLIGISRCVSIVNEVCAIFL